MASEYLAPRQPHPWPHDDVQSDFHRSLTDAYTCRVGVGAERERTVTDYEVLGVRRYSVSYHGTKWKPGQDTGTELQLYAVLKLRGGLWASVESWNDYTGWGCQDGADVRIGESEDEVVRRGLSAEGRRALGYEAVPDGR